MTTPELRAEPIQGPWQLADRAVPHRNYLVAGDGVAFAELFLTGEFGRVTGTLMAAAPELLEALKAIAGLGCVPPGQPERRMMDAAIGKARGEQP